MIENAVEKAMMLLVDENLVSAQTFVGCTTEEIASLERLHRVRLPKVYREFLLKMGKSAGSFLQGTDFLFKDLRRLREQAEILLSDTASPLKLNESDFVFAVHQGYQFLFFPIGGSEDPAVFHYEEGDESAARVFDHFSDWLLTAVQDEIVAFKSLK